MCLLVKLNVKCCFTNFNFATMTLVFLGLADCGKMPHIWEFDYITSQQITRTYVQYMYLNQVGMIICRSTV